MDPDVNQQFDILWKAVHELQSSPFIPDHVHNGFDSSQVQWPTIAGRKFHVAWTIPGVQAATATNYGTFFIAPFPCVVTGFKEVHQTLGTDGSAVTLQLEKLTSTTAPDSGTVLLTTALSLKATINTVQTGTLIPTVSNLSLAMNDRLCLKDAGVLTAVANVSVVVELKVV